MIETIFLSWKRLFYIILVNLYDFYHQKKTYLFAEVALWFFNYSIRFISMNLMTWAQYDTMFYWYVTIADTVKTKKILKLNKRQLQK